MRCLIGHEQAGFVENVSGIYCLFYRLCADTLVVWMDTGNVISRSLLCLKTKHGIKRRGRYTLLGNMIKVERSQSGSFDSESGTFFGIGHFFTGFNQVSYVIAGGQHTGDVSLVIVYGLEDKVDIDKLQFTIHFKIRG